MEVLGGKARKETELACVCHVVDAEGGEGLEVSCGEDG